ncbi:DUF362 domain-containing protein [Clostridium sp. DJ247]|uniref:DUF362 domain-containing protein n=1 Tax=Clostridium sp. DJ247 TaxID=2726188 RepID=UPI001627FC08|nr:DUF362 domain-containing protein [Clostridium sp. DJ247]MBC2580962.1 DUF362 domain-containing protein [Clostridium sp. DJ247]
MEKVYFKSVESYLNTEEINQTAVDLLKKLVEENNINFEMFIPLKVHFGEKGNKTFIESKKFKSIIEFLKEKNIESAFIETNVLYKGQRTTATTHKKLAVEHGFTMLPIIIADGEYGEEYEEVEIKKKHFNKCKIGKEIAKQKQIIVLSHFKGHALAGFGGAIKQLAMGCASRGGKLAQHANSIPKINYLKCKACGVCSLRCPENAITLNRKAKIDKDKCVGCASCMAICPHQAISNSWLASLSKAFNERLAEYAYAAHNGKSNIYITFAFNITKHCDCEGHSMKPIVKDLGVFASTDPVALDQACLDMLDKVNGRTVFGRGRYTLEYAEKIGLGSRKYEMIEII